MVQSSQASEAIARLRRGTVCLDGPGAASSYLADILAIQSRQPTQETDVR